MMKRPRLIFAIRIPKAIATIEAEKIKNLSKSSKAFEHRENLSITQLEVLKAIDANIPIFTFVDARVMHDHLFYEKNKDKGIIESIEFPSIEKRETAIYIFEFINFLRFRSKNNSIVAKYWKGRYLWEGYLDDIKEREEGKTLLKEAADEGSPEAQLRYAFTLSNDLGNEEIDKYLWNISKRLPSKEMRGLRSRARSSGPSRSMTWAS